MKALLGLMRSLLGQLYSTIDEVPCKNPVQVDLLYGDERRGDCLDRRYARATELRKRSDFGIDARMVDVEICDRCAVKDALAHAVEPLQRMAMKEWPAEWPEWRNKK